MAIIQSNALVKGLSGSIGSLVFRQVRGKTILAGKGNVSRKQSEKQRENRSKFQCASRFAKAAMLDEDKKAYYWRKAKKMKLPNAYTAAISDYMRKAEIKVVDTRGYKGRVNDVIRVSVFKKDFEVSKVEVRLKYSDGALIESGMCCKADKGLFVYKAISSADVNRSVIVDITVYDKGGRVVMERVV